MVGLVDCNSFYASCERIFRPDIGSRPVVVLSNNDGCIIAMDRKAKESGIKRGTPYFQVKADLAAAQAAVFSSNYALYQDISNRIMEILNRHVKSIETYSIDEAFLFLNDNRIPLEELGRLIREDVSLSTGVPVSIGFGRTKTLAKIANRLAKNRPDTGGIYHLREEEETQVLASVNVLDIWGVGRRKTAFLLRHGIRTALQLREAPDYWVRKHLTTTSLNTVWELRGRPSIQEELKTPSKQMILSSLSFSRPVRDAETLEEAVSRYAATAVRKLTAQRSEAAGVTVFIHTHRYKEPFFSGSREIVFERPTAYLPDIIRCAIGGLRSVYRPGYDYIKAGVCLFGIDTAERYQYNLFSEERDEKRRMTEAVREISGRFGPQAICSGMSGLSGDWVMQRRMLSPCYTTRWSDLPVVC